MLCARVSGHHDSLITAVVDSLPTVEASYSVYGSLANPE